MRLYVDMRSRIGQALYVRGEFDPAVFGPIAEILPPGGTFLDIGANIGYYSILALDFIGPNGQVHAFEVDPRPIHCLTKSVRKAGLKQISVHHTAVGSDCGKGILHQDSECGNSYVSVRSEPGLFVPIITLDTWHTKNDVERVDVIKIDVEGMEVSVLKGGRALIEQFKPLLVVEADERHLARNGTNLREMQELLESMHYDHQLVPHCWTQTIVAKHRCMS